MGDMPQGVEVVQIDGEGNTVRVASASADELSRAWSYHCEVADRLRLEPADCESGETRTRLGRDEREHRAVAVSVYSAIEARGESL